MAKIIFVDIYKRSSARISKDTNGGYGTENLFGPHIVSKLAQWALKKSVFWPNLSFAQLFSELESISLRPIFLSGGVSQCYSKIKGELSGEDTCFVFVCSSIVCFESELKFSTFVFNLLRDEPKLDIRLILCGTAAKAIQHKIKIPCIILSGAYEFFPQNKKVESVNHLSEHLPKPKVGINIIDVSIGNPDKLNLIDWSHFPRQNVNKLVSKRKIFPYIASRGCPYSCYVYCTYPAAQGRKVVHESIESVVAKLILLSKQQPRAHVIFRDPVFSIDLRYAKSLLNEIANQKLDMTFTAELHLRNIDAEFCEIAAAAKLEWIKVGIESVSEEVRSASGRYSVSNDEQRTQIRLAQSHGIKVDGMFILCQPADTYESSIASIDYSIALGLDMAQFSVFTPYPGTPAFTAYKPKITVEHMEQFSQFELVFRHDKISARSASSLVGYAHRKFYLNLLRRKFLQR